MSKRHVVVTGATGFLGKNLIPALLKNKYSVAVISLDKIKIFGKSVSYHATDLTREVPTNSMSKASAIVHIAGEIAIGASLNAPRERIDNNVGMTLSVLEAARLSGSKPLVVFISTTQMYGRTKRKKVNEQEPVFPVEPYSASKIMCETLLALYADLYGIPYITLRCESFYGPHQRKGMFISDIIEKMITQENVSMGPLLGRRNFTYVGDVAEAIVLALKAPVRAHNQIYNITGLSTSLSGVFAMLQKIISRKMRKKISVAKEVGAPLHQRLKINPFAVSTQKARHSLKWHPRTHLKKGLEKTVDYFLKIKIS